MSEELDRTLAALGLSVESIDATSRRVGFLKESAPAATPGTPAPPAGQPSPQNEATRKVLDVHGKAHKVHKGSPAERAKWRKEDKHRKSERHAYYKHNKKRLAKRRAKLAQVHARLGESYVGLVRQSIQEFVKHVNSAVAGSQPKQKLESFIAKPKDRTSFPGMLEELNALDAHAISGSNEDVVKTFARLGLVSEFLAEHFNACAEDMIEFGLDEDYRTVGTILAALAEDMEANAKSLQEHVADRFDLAGLWTEFLPRHGLVMEAVGVFARSEGLISEKKMKEMANLSSTKKEEEEGDNDCPEGKKPSETEGKKK